MQVCKEIHVPTLTEAPAAEVSSPPARASKHHMADLPTLQHQDPFPSTQTEFLLNGPAGVLECVADVPESNVDVPATIILSHPHPHHGGTMHNKVVTIMERSMRELGLRTVQFNFRGVGLSEGEFDDGYGEADDLFSVAEWVRRSRPDDDLWLGGFSFGAYVSLRCAQNLQLGQLILVAPPVDRYGFAELDDPRCPWLVVQGDEDDVVSFDSVQLWVESRKHPPDFIAMERTGHFFHRRLMDLRGLLKNGVRDQLPGNGS